MRIRDISSPEFHSEYGMQHQVAKLLHNKRIAIDTHCAKTSMHQIIE